MARIQQLANRLMTMMHVIHIFIFSIINIDKTNKSWNMLCWLSVWEESYICGL